MSKIFNADMSIHLLRMAQILKCITTITNADSCDNIVNDAGHVLAHSVLADAQIMYSLLQYNAVFRAAGGCGRALLDVVSVKQCLCLSLTTVNT